MTLYDIRIKSKIGTIEYQGVTKQQLKKAKAICGRRKIKVLRKRKQK